MFLDMEHDGLNPDGAVVDGAGNLWVAQWGAGRVAAYSRDGTFLRSVVVAGQHSSCPAFGGSDLRTLFCTTALQGVSDAEAAKEPHNGMTFAMSDVAQGQKEHKVLL